VPKGLFLVIIEPFLA